MKQRRVFRGGDIGSNPPPHGSVKSMGLRRVLGPNGTEPPTLERKNLSPSLG